ncbi:MAG: carboxypeptidase regulatory-like domain-containing protein [Leptolyngbya sp. SIO1E4]|nr:carboxypeptidase regulatory-like domain-containing protein [Leptolyngbya sp. SIO1E4]
MIGLHRFAKVSLRGGLLALIGGVVTPAIALAHGVEIKSRSLSAVQIQATYDSGEPMAGAQVQVYAPEDPETSLFTGTADEAGRYLFVPDRPGDWEVSVRQAGHGDIAVIPVSEAGTLAAGFTNTTGLTALQRGIMAGAVAWGCVGTALYFRRGKH